MGEAYQGQVQHGLVTGNLPSLPTLEAPQTSSYEGWIVWCGTLSTPSLIQTEA